MKKKQDDSIIIYMICWPLISVLSILVGVLFYFLKSPYDWIQAVVFYLIIIELGYIVITYSERHEKNVDYKENKVISLGLGICFGMASFITFCITKYFYQNGLLKINWGLVIIWIIFILISILLLFLSILLFLMYMDFNKWIAEKITGRKLK